MTMQVLTSDSNWKWPDVEGLRDFEGDLVHTASWPEGYDLTNKTVAVIGNGASGIQLLPAIRPGELPAHDSRGKVASDNGHRCQEAVPYRSYTDLGPTTMDTRAGDDGRWPDAQGDRPGRERKLYS